MKSIKPDNRLRIKYIIADNTMFGGAIVSHWCGDLKEAKETQRLYGGNIYKVTLYKKGEAKKKQR